MSEDPQGGTGDHYDPMQAARMIGEAGVGVGMEWWPGAKDSAMDDVMNQTLTGTSYLSDATRDLDSQGQGNMYYFDQNYGVTEVKSNPKGTINPLAPKFVPRAHMMMEYGANGADVPAVDTGGTFTGAAGDFGMIN